MNKCYLSRFVYSVLAIHDLRKGVGCSAESGVIDKDVISTVTMSQNPMPAIVHIAYHNFTSIQFWFDLAVGNFSFEG